MIIKDLKLKTQPQQLLVLSKFNLNYKDYSYYLMLNNFSELFKYFGNKRVLESFQVVYKSPLSIIILYYTIFKLCGAVD